MKKLITLIMVLLITSCSYGPVYADVFESCIFMRSVHLSDPHHKEARVVLDDCTKHLTEEQKFDVIAQWHSRWKEEVRKDRIIVEQIRAEEYQRSVRWSGCSPVKIVDQYGRWNPTLQRRFDSLYCIK